MGPPGDKMNIKDMRKVECEYCGGIFLVAQAVVLDEKGEFHYYCSKGCAMKAKAPRAPRPRTQSGAPMRQ